jgi:uncharacterized protein YndB with AHSA1/START domain
MPIQSGDLIREVRIEASPEDVFSYFVDPEKLVSWKATAAEADARPGGRFRLDVTGRGDIAWGEYLEIDPPRRVTFTWNWENETAQSQGPPAPSVVEVTLTQEGENTLLRLIHSGIPSANRERSGAGWAHYLSRLVLVASGRDPGPDPWAGEPVTHPNEHLQRRPDHGHRPE